MKSFMVSFTRLPRLVFTFGVAAVLGSLAVPAHAQVTLDMVPVSDPGNTADTAPAGYGAVADAFQIMKYEWTNSQYTDFLNSVDPNGTNPNSVYSENMDSDALWGGLSFIYGAASGSKYAAKTNMGDKPVNFVSWFDAARVSNWLMNGATGTSSTETGAYTLSGTSTAPAVNSGATYYVPTEDQWYKAAYYRGGNTNAGYWDYATQSDTEPTVVSSDSIGFGSAGSIGNFANYVAGADWNGQDGNVTTVGTNGGPSAYNTFDMVGNITEWNDLAGVAGPLRGFRGGYWNDERPFFLSSSYTYSYEPSIEIDSVGFRLAATVAVPEPSTFAMALAGLAFGGWHVLRVRLRRMACGMGRSLVALLLVTFSLMAGSASAAPITMDMVTVGDPGNAADTTGYGAVANSFKIMKYEFTNQQYADFLNSVAATDTYSLYNASMGSDPRGGITQSGASGAYTYAVKSSMGDKPVNYVSWFDAARVSNWLMNGATGTSSTETGAYTLNNAISGNAPAVNSGATFYIPTEDQWYKAAYYKGGSTNAGYWDYATQSDTGPTAVTSGSTGIGSAGNAGNFANYNRGADWNSQDGNVTTVGTNGGASARAALADDRMGDAEGFAIAAD